MARVTPWGHIAWPNVPGDGDSTVRAEAMKAARSTKPAARSCTEGKFPPLSKREACGSGSGELQAAGRAPARRGKALASAKKKPCGSSSSSKEEAQNKAQQGALAGREKAFISPKEDLCWSGSNMNYRQQSVLLHGGRRPSLLQKRSRAGAVAPKKKRKTELSSALPHGGKRPSLLQKRSRAAAVAT